MSEHRATIQWRRDTPDFDVKTYSREHQWLFPKSGRVIEASATPAYKGNPECVDPEEAFVASIASCHMLTFLAIASGRKFTVDSYEDDAVGVLENVAENRMGITRVTLRPKIVFAGQAPDARTLEALHHKAHEQCFIANSVKTEVDVVSDVPAGV